MTQKFSMKLIPALMLLGFAGTASASGFAIQNQTGSGNGNAFAGAAAAAEDAGTIYFNPAGMTNLPKGHNISASGTLLNRKVEFNNKGSSTTPGFGFGSSFPLPAGDGGDAGGLAVLPAGFWAYGIAPNLSVGLGFGPTFGNKTEYQSDFIGRNAGFFFEMKQININPSIAYKLNDMVSLGAGINFAHNESTFKQGNPLVMPAAGYLPNNYLKVTADDWAVGYNLGATFQLSPATRIGLAYRSELEFDLEGKEKWKFTAAGFGPVAPLVNQKIKGELKTPANFSLAVSHKASDKLELLGDVTWTDWSVVSTLTVKSKAGVPLQELPYNFEDTYRVGFGASYQYNEQVKTRFGVAYDKTPVQHAADRTMTLPDSDRIWLSFGVKYSLSKISSIDLGYSHIFFDDANTARQVKTGFPGVQTVRQTIRGDFDTTADILSMQYNHTF